jgi:RimJ/RimL family protein N-acetyltransferase
MDPSPTPAAEVLRTERLVGTRATAHDLDDLASLYADARVMATLASDGRPWARARVAEVLDRHLAHWREHGFGLWIFRDARTGAFVGRAGLRHCTDEGLDEPELFYAVASSSWRRGFGTEIARRLVGVAFVELGLASLIAFALAANTPSLRVLRKCGFERDGEVIHAGLPHVLLRLARPTRPPGLHASGA